LVFVCQPDVEENHTAIISAIEQAKMKLNIVTRDKLEVTRFKRSQEFSDETFNESYTEMANKMSAVKTPTKIKYDGK
jgi:hypothetical protein